MDIKAIVLDIDGTLVNDEKKITLKTKEMLIKAQQNGIKVILASGRPTSGIYPYAKTLEMDKYNGYLVGFNGTTILNYATNQVLFNQTISTEISKNILNHMKQFDVVPMIAKNEFLYVHDAVNDQIHSPETKGMTISEYEASITNLKLIEVDDLAEFVQFPLQKILIAGEPDYLEKHHDAIKAPFEAVTTAVASTPFYLEFTDKGIDKASALENVLPEHGILPEHVVAFGDGHNDKTMIEYAGTGVAMANAVTELKNSANEVTLSNNEDGIAAFLEKYL